MSHKNRIIVFVSAFLALLFVIVSAGCVFHTDISSQDTNLTVGTAQKINLSTGVKADTSNLSLNVENPINSTDAKILTLDFNPQDVLDNNDMASLYFSINEPWVLKAHDILEAFRTYVNQTPAKKPINIYIILYEYDKANNRVFIGETPITISADSVSIENSNAVFLISPDVIASGNYELLITPYSGLSPEISYVYYENMYPGEDWAYDLNVETNAQFTTGSNAVQPPSGIYTTEKSWTSVKKSAIPALAWGFMQTTITATPTAVPAYDPSVESSYVLLDMPWRLHWTIDNSAPLSSVSVNSSGSKSVNSSANTSAVTTATTASTPNASSLGKTLSAPRSSGDEPEEQEDEGAGDDENNEDKKTDASSAGNKTASSTPVATPVQTPATAVNPSSIKSSSDYYKSVEFILYRYEDGYYQMIDSFGWNRGYSSDKEQYTKSYQPGTYALIGYLRGVGVTMDFQKQMVIK